MGTRLACLRSTIKKGKKTFPVLVGMATGRQIHGFSFVPNFSPSDSNLTIAKRLQTPLEDKWQRPAQQNRINSIGDLYDQRSTSDQIMVNPVLLGAIPGNEGNISVVGAPTALQGSITQELVVVDVKSGDSVWVIDGQHRINGMKNSNQPMPFVLLFDEKAQTNYTGAYLAELFSIVTTEAKSMKTIHKEWMAYAFQLGEYGDEDHRKLMQIAIEIATTPNFGPDHANENYLFGEIQFNDDVPIVSDNVGAFKYTAFNLVRSLNMSSTRNLLERCTPKELAAVITDFISALRECHGPPTESSLLFGEHARSRYTCVGDGLLVAWLMHLETEDTLPNYEETRNLLQHIGFDKCTWDLLAWNNGPGQPQRKPMKVTTRNTLYQLFESRIPVPGDLGQFLLGKEHSWIRLEFGIANQDGHFVEESVYTVTIDSLGIQNMTLDVPFFRGQKRNRVRHYYVRDAAVSSHCHTPNVRIENCQLVNERGANIIQPKTALAALKKQNSGLDIGNGRMSYIMLKVNALDERNGFNIRLEVNSTG